MATAVETDVLIVGGGLTGSLLALELRQRNPGLRSLVLDRGSGELAQDDRGLALAWSSCQVLQQLGCWQPLAPYRSPITRIHVSQQQPSPAAQIDASRERVPALGYVVMAGALQETLHTQAAAGGIETWWQATVAGWQDHHQQGLRVWTTDGREVHTRLLVIADGSQSPTRQLAGIGQTGFTYEQVAMGARVELSRDLAGVAYERFTPAGPVALLPLGQRQAALVWCLDPLRADALLDYSEADFRRLLSQVLPPRVGPLVRVERQGRFPLQLALAERITGYRTVVIGNACHTLHPVAGQGYNLGVRDITTLGALLRTAPDPGAEEVLATYAARRQPDYQQVTALTDGLVGVFSSRNPLLTRLRGAGLQALRTCPPLSKPLARKAMGMI